MLSVYVKCLVVYQMVLSFFVTVKFRLLKEDVCVLFTLILDFVFCFELVYYYFCLLLLLLFFFFFFGDGGCEQRGGTPTVTPIQEKVKMTK